MRRDVIARPIAVLAPKPAADPPMNEIALLAAPATFPSIRFAAMLAPEATLPTVPASRAVPSKRTKPPPVGAAINPATPAATAVVSAPSPIVSAQPATWPATDREGAGQLFCGFQALLRPYRTTTKATTIVVSKDK